MEGIEVIIVVAFCVIIFFLMGKAFLGKAKRKGEKLTKKDMLQMKFERKAARTDEESVRALGESGREAFDKVTKKENGSGCLGRGCGCMVVLIVIAIVVLLILSQLDPDFIDQLLKNLTGNGDY